LRCRILELWRETLALEELGQKLERDPQQ
jgi:hypothetical protein